MQINGAIRGLHFFLIEFGLWDVIKFIWIAIFVFLLLKCFQNTFLTIYNGGMVKYWMNVTFFPMCHNRIKSALAFQTASVLGFSLPRGSVCIIFKQTVHLCKNTAACLRPQILLNLPLSFSSKLTGVCEYGESRSGSCIQLFPGALHISGEWKVWSRGRGVVVFGGDN